MRSREFDHPNRQIIVIAHNIRSVENVGAIIRSAECFGIKEVFATGYTPNLEATTDGSKQPLLPHVKDKLATKLSRTSVGAIDMVELKHHSDIYRLISDLINQGYRLVGLEQNERSVDINIYRPPTKIALLIGEEVHGISLELINKCEDLIEIPMFGQKESLNVSVATGIALFKLTTTTATA